MKMTMNAADEPERGHRPWTINAANPLPIATTLVWPGGAASPTTIAWRTPSGAIAATITWLNARLGT